MLSLVRGLALAVCLLFASALVGCARPRAGYVEVVLDTDIDRRFDVTLKVRVVPLADPNASLRDASAGEGGARMDAGAINDGGAPDAEHADASDPLASLDVLAIDPNVRSFEWTRQADSGLSFPASFSVLPLAGAPDGTPLLVEVEVSTPGDFTANNPPLSWKQYAVVRPTAGQPSVVRMFLSSRCDAPVRGCAAVPDRACRVDRYCADRGMTCGDDGQCVSALDLLQWSPESVRATCAPGECGPRCAPCAIGSTCSREGRCVRTPSRSVPCLDRDGDGYGVGSQCFGEDCDDNDRRNFRDNVEVCDNRDNNCDTRVDEDEACSFSEGRSCATAIPVDLVAAERVVINSDHRGGGTLLEPACRFSGHEGGEGRERWFRVTYPGDQELDLRSITSMAHGTDTILLAFEDCSPGSLVACNDDVRELANSSSRVVLHGVGDRAPRTVLVAVDSYQRFTEGPFRFEASRRDDSQRTCQGMIDVSLGGTFAGVLSDPSAPSLACTDAGEGAAIARYHVAPGPYEYALQASVPGRRSIVSLGADFQCDPSRGATCVRSERMTENDTNYLVSDPAFDGWVFVEGRVGTPYMLNVSGQLFLY